MPITRIQQEPHWLIRLEGQITLASAAELKDLLLQWLAARKNLELDLDRVEEIDIAILQLLWVSAREAARTGLGFGYRASNAAIVAACDSGFDQSPGFPVQEVRNG